MSLSRDDLLPFSVPLIIGQYDPPRRLWHVPNTPPGICPGCTSKIENDRSKITIAGHDWHQECFRCSLCQQPIPIDKCVTKDDLVLHLHCALECFSERCAKCTKLVDQKEGLQVLGRVYHKSCLCCEKCGDKQSINVKLLAIYQQPYCSQCYEDLIDLFPKCITCKRPILPTGERREFFCHGEKYFIHYPDCLKCAFCPKPPREDQCMVYDNKLCCNNCYTEAHKRICAACNEPIFEQSSKMENIHWHQNHFECTVCRTPLKANTCVFNFGVLKCRSCAAEDKPICVGCGKTILDQGVQACNGIWHSQCLKCQFCHKNVINKKFSNVSSRPCCEDCYKIKREEGEIDKSGALIKKRSSKSHKSSKKDNDSHKYDSGSKKYDSGSKKYDSGKHYDSDSKKHSSKGHKKSRH